MVFQRLEAIGQSILRMVLTYQTITSNVAMACMEMLQMLLHRRSAFPEQTISELQSSITALNQ